MDSLKNLISLCENCHSKVTGKEMEYAELLYSKINGKNIRFDYSQRCMQGKTYLREELNKKYIVELTYGSDTANKRIDWNIDKSHGNDAICITNLKVNSTDCNVKDWHLKPLRSKNKSLIEEVNGFKHRDIICYIKRNKEKYIGYIIALNKTKNSCSFVDFKGKEFKRYGLNNCKLIQRQKSIMFA